MSRIGRSLKDLLAFLDEIHALGIDLYLHQQGSDITTPASKAMFQMCGVFAEFERSIVRERINAGLARVKSDGRRLGRPTVGAEVEQAIQDALERGDKGMRKIAREIGVGVSVVQRVRVNALRVNDGSTTILPLPVLSSRILL